MPYLSHSVSGEHNGSWHASMSKWPPLPATDAPDHGQFPRATTELQWSWTNDVGTQAYHASMPHVLHTRANAAWQSGRAVHVSTWTHLLLFSVPIDSCMFCLGLMMLNNFFLMFVVFYFIPRKVGGGPRMDKCWLTL